MSSEINSLKFRQVTLDDVSRLVAIETEATPFPWSQKAHTDGVETGYPSLLIQNDSEILGFIIFNWYADECHLLNIVVGQESQGKGLAKTLINKMCELASHETKTKVILEVRDTNFNAIRLYHSLGFSQIGRRKNYYRGHLDDELLHQDAIVMQKAL